MNRPDQDRSETSTAADERFWQAFAQAAGFDDELRELIASCEIDAVEAHLEVAVASDDAVADDLLAADRLHTLLLAARATSVEPATVELAPVELAPVEPASGRSTGNVDRQPRRQYVWLAALTGVALAMVAWVATAIFLDGDGTQAGGANAEIASAQRLAQEWVAVREESVARDVALAEETDLDADSTVDPFAFEETPDWLVLVVARQAELAGNGIEEATP